MDLIDKFNKQNNKLYPDVKLFHPLLHISFSFLLPPNHHSYLGYRAFFTFSPAGKFGIWDQMNY